MKFILSIDQGTTSTRALLVNEECEILCSSYKEHKQIYPQPGWVEHDPMEIWENTKQVVGNVLEQAKSFGVLPRDIKGIGIANQGETVMLWDKITGLPLHNAIVWQCRRTATYIDQLKQRPGFEKMAREKSGLVPDAYFSASKIKWIIENIPGIAKSINENRVLAGTLDSWLIWKLTGGTSFLTDPSTASRTMLFNINSLKWDKELLDTFNIPPSILASVAPSSGHFGVTNKKDFLGLELPITGSIVDQQGALFGHTCFEKGMAKNTYGTGCFLLMNTGEKRAHVENGLLATIAWQIKDTTIYAIDGGVYIAGAAIQWLRDGLGIIKDYKETEKMALSVEDTGDVYFVPAFSGLAAPYWDQFARGTLVGITASTKREHIVRATLESIAFQVKNILESMDESIHTLRVDGGITKNNFLMQFQADILGIPVEVTEVSETTALGAAFLAGLSGGVWKDQEDLKKFVKIRKKYTPQMDQDKRDKLMYDWNEAVKRSRNWANR